MVDSRWGGCLRGGRGRVDGVDVSYDGGYGGQEFISNNPRILFMSKISKHELRDLRQTIVMKNVMYLYGTYEQEGLNLDTFAAITAVTRRTLWRYRTKGAFPSFQFLSVTAEFFRVHIVELLCTKEELRQMLSDLVGPDDVRTPTIADQSLDFYIDYEQTLRTNLRRWRCRRGMYPSKLVRRAGGHISCMSHYRYETRCDSYPLWHIPPVASALEVSPLELLTPQERLPEVVVALAAKYLPKGNSPSA